MVEAIVVQTTHNDVILAQSHQPHRVLDASRIKLTCDLLGNLVPQYQGWTPCGIDAEDLDDVHLRRG
jgi:hypothetical protein